MKSKTVEVLTAVMAERDLNQSDIARAINIKPQAVQQWLSGKTTPKGKNLEALANYLHIEPAVIQYGINHTASVPTVIDTEDGFVSIPRMSAKGACNSQGGEINDEYTYMIEMVRVGTNWLRAKAASANWKKLEVITASGDSMEPTIKNLDFVFVDTSCKTVRQDGVYAVTYAGETYIKRCQKDVEGGLNLISDNKKYPPIHVAPDQLERVIVEGRCALACSVDEL